MIETISPFPKAFGPYILLRRLGTGGMAETFLALRNGENGAQKLVVIKCMLETFCGDRRYEDLFCHEARLSLLMQHPNVVDTWDFIQIESRFAMIMAFLNGITVAQLIAASSSLPPFVGVAIAIQALQGLSYFHHLTDLSGHPLHPVHRDITPQNIFVCFDGLVKIIDFGVARYGDDEDIQQGRLVGKCAYMSPEQCFNQSVDARADLFSMAAILYEMITGISPFARENDIKTLDAINNEDPQSPASRNPRISSFLSRIIMRGLAKDPAARYQTADDLAADLRCALKILGKPFSPLVIRNAIAPLFADKIVDHNAWIAQTLASLAQTSQNHLEK